MANNCCSELGSNFYIILFILFLYRTGEFLLGPTTRLYIYQQVCLHEVEDSNNGAQICSNLENHTALEEKVQIKAANVLQIYRIAMNLPSFLVTLLCGACSDQFGRKLPMLATCMSLIVASTMYLISTRMFIISIALVIVGSAMSSFLGKNSLLIMSTQSYVIDITNLESRTASLTILQAMSYLGQSFGSFLSGFLLNFTEYSTIFIVVLITNIFLMLIITCGLDEARQREAGAEGSLKRIKELLLYGANLKHIMQSVAVLWKPRSGNRSFYLIIFLIAIFLNQFIQMGASDVLLLYTQKTPFNWPDPLYGYYVSFSYVSLGVCQLTFPFINQFLNFKDIVLVILGMASKFSEFIILIFASHSWLV